jgi:hypothetical protein
MGKEEEDRKKRKDQRAVRDSRSGKSISFLSSIRTRHDVPINAKVREKTSTGFPRDRPAIHVREMRHG